MPGDEKPEQILRLEQHLGLRLHPLRTGNVTDHQNRKCYQLNDQGEIVGLNLSYCSITDWSFLKELTSLTSLALSGNQIRGGSFLKELTSLTSLALSGNQITDWSFLKGLTQLTSLDLAGNRINDGSLLKGLTALTSLDLAGNRISDGSFLKGLTSLTSLDLADNSISDGALLKGLTSLTSLNLRGNSINDGAFLKELTSLTSADLSYVRLSDWSFLQGLTHLSSLHLAGNGIGDGTFLQRLISLTSLDLGNNNIRDGSFLHELTALISLNLRGNSISDGSFLQRLTALTSLNLSRNLISNGSQLKNLLHLTFLDLSNCYLKVIPPEVLGLNIELVWDEIGTRPNTVNLTGNPIETPPPEIMKRGDRAIRAWFAEEKEGVVPLNEVKVILVGDGEAGKTTLRKRLMKLRANKQEPQTHGIEIHPHKIPCKGGDILVHFWDFGGQEILHATHQFFLSRRTLYIVVLDGRKEEDVDYWLKHIESFGGNSPILICLNKLDQNPAFDVDRKTLQKKYPGIRAFYRLKCLDSKDVGVNRIRKELSEHLMQVELTRAEWPQRWFEVKKRLQKEDRPYLERKEFEGYCCDAGIADEDSQKTLIRFLSDLGIALHFEDEHLDLLQILNPKWATQAVYRLISAPSVAAAHGLLKTGDLKDILRKPKAGDYEYPREKHGYIVSLMRKFELCYEVNEKEVLLPDLLGVDEPSHEFPTENVLRLRYEYEYLPKSIMPRLIVKLHTDIDGHLQWRTGVVLKSRRWDSRARVKSDKNARRVTIEVAGARRRDYFAVIFDAIESIHDGFTKLAFKRKVPLPDRPEVAVDYEDLVYLRDEEEEYYHVGSLKKKYEVASLLDGVDLVQKRRNTISESGNIYNIEKFYQGDDMSNDVKIGNNNRNVAVNYGDNVTQVVAESIRNSFNRAATAKTVELKDLLEQLTREMEDVIKTLPEEEASKAGRHLENAVKEATAEKPSKDFWEFSKQGVIAAAKLAGDVVQQGVAGVVKVAGAVQQGVAGAVAAAGVVGAKVGGLIEKISEHLPFQVEK